jgi:hypothetical protein
VHRLVTGAVLVAAVALAASPADGATVRSARFDPPTLTTRWVLESGDCASVVSISRARRVDSYGFFTRRHYTWPVGNCLALSNAKTLTARAGTYYVRRHALPPAVYYLQIQYCHDSDLPKLGNYYCRGSNFVSVRIPAAGSR